MQKLIRAWWEFHITYKLQTWRSCPSRQILKTWLLRPVPRPRTWSYEAKDTSQPWGQGHGLEDFNSAGNWSLRWDHCVVFHSKCYMTWSFCTQHCCEQPFYRPRWHSRSRGTSDTPSLHAACGKISNKMHILRGCRSVWDKSGLYGHRRW